MTNPTEAEATFKQWMGDDDRVIPATPMTVWQASWSARGRYDEQRIAALVAALEEIEQQPGDCDCVFIAERALAGQTEDNIV